MLNCCSSPRDWVTNNSQGFLLPSPAACSQAHTHLCAMLELKFVKESPGIPQVRVYLHCSVEPFSGLGYFTLTPEQPVEKSKSVLTYSLFKGTCQSASTPT